MLLLNGSTAVVSFIVQGQKETWAGVIVILLQLESISQPGHQLKTNFGAQANTSGTNQCTPEYCRYIHWLHRSV